MVPNTRKSQKVLWSLLSWYNSFPSFSLVLCTHTTKDVYPFVSRCLPWGRIPGKYRSYLTSASGMKTLINCLLKLRHNLGTDFFFFFFPSACQYSWLIRQECSWRFLHCYFEGCSDSPVPPGDGSGGRIWSGVTSGGRGPALLTGRISGHAEVQAQQKTPKCYVGFAVRAQAPGEGEGS